SISRRPLSPVQWFREIFGLWPWLAVALVIEGVGIPTRTGLSLRGGEDPHRLCSPGGGPGSHRILADGQIHQGHDRSGNGTIRARGSQFGTRTESPRSNSRATRIRWA